MKRMKNERVFVLVKDEPEYVKFEVIGVFSEEGMQIKLKEFAEQERTMLNMFMNDSAKAIEEFKQKRAEIAYADAKLLEKAGQHLTMIEIHTHERNMRDIEILTNQISQLNQYNDKASQYSDEKLAQDYMNRLHLVFQEFVVD